MLLTSQKFSAVLARHEKTPVAPAQAEAREF